MADFTYPGSDLDRKNVLLGLLGSHWENTYAGNTLVEQLAFAQAAEGKQTRVDFEEMQSAISRHDIPVFHTDRWFPLILRESDRNSDLLKYGDEAVYGNQPDTGILYAYGVHVGRETSSFEVPESLAGVNVAVNRLQDQSLTWVSGIDFFLSDVGNRIVFRTNPFDNPLIPTRQVYDGDVVTDREAMIWLFHGKFDKRYLHEQWGYVLGLDLPSSKSYKDVMNAVFDSFVRGTFAEAIGRVFSATYGIRMVSSAEETIASVTRDRHGLSIVSDKTAYRFASTADAIVAEGDKVYSGDSLTDSLRVHELNRGGIPTGLAAISVGHGLLKGDFFDSVAFLDKEVPLVVEDNVDGKTKVSFELGGFSEDVTAFWEEVHKRGVSAGQTLANLLDVRGDSATTEPTAASLPSTVNPLQFLIDNLLRFNTFVVVVHADDVLSEPGMQSARALRRIIPPWTSVIVIYEFEPSDTANLGAAATDTAAGASESIDTFDGMEPIGDTYVADAMMSDSVGIHYVEGVCL